MRHILFGLFSLIVLNSCWKKEDSKFQKIPYKLSDNYKDSLGTKIVPNGNHQYWAYMIYSYNFGKEKHKILSQGGDTLQKQFIKTETNVKGFFEGCYPNYCCNYIITINNGKVKYLKSKQDFINFLGKIDNLEEAVLLAMTYGYLLDNDFRGSSYRIKDDSYELHLMKFHENPPRKESVEIKINQKGNIQTKSLGLYCKGQKCFE
ncbi:hypothetical protein [Flavobacterium sp. LC2016-01]|uniref:hypothetical protein n=1 Tax=Flavobacterium sp. LC2016-01 TaxID=2675876 RepID=UPI0012BA70DA|nr:hypothetical protein [Flavobacterium sp. LC2016-01]MTH16407.1 hypothetical protein [Flavobacterium sp. LC2016-01]